MLWHKYRIISDKKQNKKKCRYLQFGKRINVRVMSKCLTYGVTVHINFVWRYLNHPCMNLNKNGPDCIFLTLFFLTCIL